MLFKNTDNVRYTKKSIELKAGRYALEPVARRFTYNVVFTLKNMQTCRGRWVSGFALLREQ
jgi:hypothetical protein